MVVNIQELTESLAHPPIRHAAMVHMPIAFAALGLLLLLLLLLTGGRSAYLRWSTAALFLLAAGLAYLTSISGEAAEDHLLEVADLAHESLEEHEWLGEWAWVPLAATGILTALTAMPGLPARFGFLALALLAGIFCSGWLALTAHHGGQLVYVHSVGVGTLGEAPSSDDAGNRTSPDLPLIEVPQEEGTKAGEAIEAVVVESESTDTQTPSGASNGNP